MNNIDDVYLSAIEDCLKGTGGDNHHGFRGYIQRNTDFPHMGKIYVFDREDPRLVAVLIIEFSFAGDDIVLTARQPEWEESHGNDGSRTWFRDVFLYGEGDRFYPFLNKLHQLLYSFTPKAKVKKPPKQLEKAGEAVDHLGV